jgi:ABC-type multidrug transport system fused ATPase/permease subunit
MIKELKLFFFIIIIFLFIFFNTNFYFSNDNKKKNYRSYSSINTKLEEYSKNIPILKSNTDNIIVFVTKTNNKNNKIYNFWNLLNNNEK